MTTLATREPDALTIGPVNRLEGVRGVGPRGATFVAWWLLTLALLDGPGPCGSRCWAFLALTTLGPLVCFRWMFRDSTRRSISWRLDEEGAARLSSDGRTRFLRWGDVEAIRAREDVVILRGGDVDVAIPLKIVGTDGKAVAAFVAARLPAGFDLRAGTPAFGPIGPFLKRVVLAVAWTLLFLATVAGPVLIQAFGGPRIGRLGPSSLYVWAWIAFSSLDRHAREAEESAWLRPAADVKAGRTWRRGQSSSSSPS